MTREELINYSLEVLRRFLKESEGVAFTCEFFAAHAFLPLNESGRIDYRLLGPIFQRAKREGLIRQLGVSITTKSKHKSPLWVAA